MAGFVKRGWGSNKTSSNTNNNEQWSINVKMAKYRTVDSGETYLTFKLSGFKFTDKDKINKVGQNIFFIAQSTKNNSIWIYVKKDNIDDFVNILPSIEEALTKTNNYTKKSIDEFAEKIEGFIETTPTPEEEEQNNAQIASNWKELLQTMKDPEVRKRFLAFQTTFTCANNFKDATLSRANVATVLSVDPLASFVTDARTWRTKFKRNIVSGAPFIIINKVENVIPPTSMMNNDPEVKRAGGWTAVMKASGGPWYGAAYAAIKRVRKNSGIPAVFYKSKVYDVRYTAPMDPNDDKFMTVAGLVNNLTGELNNIAAQMLSDEARINGDEQPDFNKKKVGLETSSELEAFKNFILKKCESLKIHISEIGSVEDIIANAVYAYAYKKADDLNKLTEKSKNAVASAVCYAIAATFNIDSSRVGACVRYFENLSEDEASELAMSTFELYKSIASFSMSESIGEPHILSFQEYEQLLLGKARTKENIKSKFNKISERLNSVKGEEF